jgi:hypothetical protein
MKNSLRVLVFAVSMLAIYFLHANAYKLWYDEAAMLAVVHDSNPMTMQPYTYGADLGKVITLNQHINMDPGGYTLFLAILSPLVKNNFFIYRMLNELAFLTGVLLVLMMLLRQAGLTRSANLLVGVAGYFLILLISRTVLKQLPGASGEDVDSAMRLLPFYTLLRQSFYVRPYGFEVLFIAFVLYLGPWYRGGGLRAAIAPALVFLFGIVLTRYDFLIFTPCYAAAVVAYESLAGRFLSLLRSRAVWLVSVAVLVGAGLVYVFGYSRQFGATSTPKVFLYLGRFYLTSYENWVYVFLQPRNLVASVMMMFVVAGLVRRRSGLLEMIFASVFLGYMCLSVLSLHPFSFTSHHCIAMVMVMDALILKWLIDFLASTRFVDNRLVGTAYRVSARLLPWLWLPVLAISMRVVFREYRTLGRDAMRLTMVSNNEWGATKFNTRADSIFCARPGSRIYMDYMSTANANCFYALMGRSLPQGTFFCEPMMRFYEMNSSQPDNAERLQWAIRSDSDLL